MKEIGLLGGLPHRLMITIPTHRFCVLPYANALPLVHFIEETDPAARLLCRTPRTAAETLLEGRADAALVPVAGYFRRPDLPLIPGLGICANGDVTSVLLLCHRPLSEVRVVRLDPESKTSNILVQVLMRDHFRISHRVEYRRCAEEADAWVCIGDRALRAAPARETYDLAGAWKKMTGLLAGVTMLTAGAADFLVLPACVACVNLWGRRGDNA